MCASLVHNVEFYKHGLVNQESQMGNFGAAYDVFDGCDSSQTLVSRIFIIDYETSTTVIWNHLVMVGEEYQW